MTGRAWGLLALASVAGLALDAAPARARRPRREPAPAEGAPLVDLSALRPFFAALERLEGRAPGVATQTPVVRVLHFGDSHTAADYWTGRVRARLQAHFGDAGPGLLLPARPWRGYAHAGVDLGFSRDWPAVSLRQAEGDGRVGLAGAALSVPEEEALRVRGCFRGFEVTSLGLGGAPLNLGLVRPGSEPTPPWPCGAAPGALPLPDFAPAWTSSPLPSGEVVQVASQLDLDARQPLELRVHVPPGQRLLGVELYSGLPGVLYAELGLNGAEVTDLLRWDPDLRRLLLARARPDLIVLAYGTNEMGRGDLTLESYREQAASVLRLLSEESGAPLLVLAPPDRGARRRTTARRLAQQAPVIFEGLRLAARDAGAAFWDTRAAMGGPGSISAWRRRGLAQRDLVHLTRPGYERLGDLLGDALLRAYFDYRLQVRAPWIPTQVAPSAP